MWLSQRGGEGKLWGKGYSLFQLPLTSPHRRETPPLQYSKLPNWPLTKALRALCETSIWNDSKNGRYTFWKSFALPSSPYSFIYLFFFWNEDPDVCHENTQGEPWPMRITLVFCLSPKDIHIWNHSHQNQLGFIFKIFLPIKMLLVS